MRKPFETSLKQAVDAYKAAHVSWFVTVQNVAGDTTEYTTIVPVMNSAEFDASSETKALGGERSTALSRQLDRCYVSEFRQFAAPLSALEINAPKVAMGTYWILTTVSVSQGKMDVYLKWLQDLYRPALEKAGVAHFLVARPVFGAAGNEIVSARMLNDLAEIDSGPVLRRALGPEAAAIVDAKAAELMSSSNTRIVRVRSDLSYSLAP